MTSPAGMAAAFEAITVNAAKVLGLSGYGLEVGCNADFVVLQASDPAEAIRLRANRLAVVRRGQVIARSAPRLSELSLSGRPGTVDGATIRGAGDA
jgi:cytosine deaminase